MVLGVVGGMGSYATLHFFERYLEIFPAEKEWERPRIVIDNRCTMPSRVRAILYSEQYPELIKELSKAISGLMEVGCDHIVLACNTSHVFLEDVYREVPGAEKMVENMIDYCARYISETQNDDEAEPWYLIATEGTIESGIYQKVFRKYGIEVCSPNESCFAKMRYFIEAVKQNAVDENCQNKFKAFLATYAGRNLILGCTEFPVLFDFIAKTPELQSVRVVDPLELILQKLRKNFLEEKKQEMQEKL